MASNGTIRDIKPNKITGTIQEATSGVNYEFVDPAAVVQGLKIGDTVSFDVVIVAGAQIAVNLSLN